MTTPSGPGGFNLAGRWAIAGNDGSVTDLVNRTEDVVVGRLKEQVKNSPGWNKSTVDVWAQLRRGIPLDHALLEVIVNRLTGGLVTFPTKQDAIMALKKVPWTEDLVELLTGVEDGDLDDLGTWALNIRNFFGNIDFSDPDFDVEAAFQEFVSVVVQPLIRLQDKLRGLVDISWLTNEHQNLVEESGYDDPITVVSPDDPKITHDATDGVPGSTPLGCLRVECDGTNHERAGAMIAVGRGWALVAESKVKWEGITAAAAANAIRLELQPFHVVGDIATPVGGRVMVGSVASPSGSSGGAGGWGTAITGNYTVPTDGSVTDVVLFPRVTSAASAGVSKFDNTTLVASQDIPQEFVKDLLADLQSLVNEALSLWQGLGERLHVDEWDDWLADTWAHTQAEANQIRDILAGLIVTPINSAVQAIKDWWSGIVGKTQNLTSGGTIPPTAVGSSTGGSSLGQDVINTANDVQATWRKFLSALTGNDEDATATAQKNADQLAAIVANLAAAAASVSALETNLNQANGVHGGDLFERENPAGIDPGWTVSNGQPVSTHGTYVLANGQAQWDKHASAPSAQMTICIRTDPVDAKTVSLYQVITRTIGTQVRHSRCRDYIFGRVSDDRLSYVYADFWTDLNDGINYLNYVQIKYVTNGVAGSLGSPVLLAQAESVALRDSLVCGTGGGLKVYRVLRNGIPILTVTDTGNVTNAASDCRGWGFGGQTGTYLGSQVAPSAVTGISVDDDDPSAMTGTTFRAYRGTATQTPDVSHPSGAIDAVGSSVALPDNTFTVTDYITADLLWNGTTGELGITKAGTYLIGVRYQFAESGDQYPLVFINGSRRVWIGGTRQADDQIGHGSVTLYLAAGDVVRFGVALNATGRNLLGDAAGMSCYVSATRIG